MSKNGKLLFKDYDPYITSGFGERIHPITKKKTKHDGIDYGTYEKKMPTYAIEKGRVVKTGYNNINGNFVYVTYPRLNKNSLYQHLDSINVLVNQEVDENTIIGYTGKTGQATGIHLHFGWFPTSDQDKDWYSKNWEDFEVYNYVKPLSYVGNPILKDTKKNQLEVKINELRARKEPNGEILGYINKGIYNYIATETNYGYTWYKLEENYWIAYQEDWINLYSKEEIIEDNKEEKEPKKKLMLRIFDIFLLIIKRILSFFKKR